MNTPDKYLKFDIDFSFDNILGRLSYKCLLVHDDLETSVSQGEYVNDSAHRPLFDQLDHRPESHGPVVDLVGDDDLGSK